MSELSKLPNIGKDTESYLNQMGIHTSEELKKIGAEQAWLGIQLLDPSACLLRLYGLEGAIQGVKKSMLPEVRKAELKAFYHEHQL